MTIGIYYVCDVKNPLKWSPIVSLNGRKLHGFDNDYPLWSNWDENLRLAKMPIPQEDSQEDFANLPLHGPMLGDY